MITQMDKQDKEMVNHPDHYNDNPSGIECIKVVRHCNFNIGSAIKYLWRAGKKGSATEDLEKAVWYIKDEIERLLEGEGPEEPWTITRIDDMRDYNEPEDVVIEDLHEKVMKEVMEELEKFKEAQKPTLIPNEPWKATGTPGVGYPYVWCSSVWKA